TCFHSEGMEHGICLPVPADGSGACWTGADCPDGECRDPAICACGANCVSEAGWCLPAGCCAGDGDCDGGDVCIVTSGSLGVCKPELVAGYACWRDADCDFGLCEGASVCPCGAACDMEDVPGLCTAPPTGCCTQDPDCQDLKTCVFTGGFPGVCKSAPLEGQCWSAADCAVGECVGPQVCPCDADCDAEDEPGWCTSEYPGCCQVDGDCVGGSSCVVAGDAMGVCRPDPGAGACWEDGDCPGGYCAGADLCPCGIDCPQASPGLCSDLPAGCCLSAAGCAAGQVCASPKWDDGPGICKDPVAGGCWSDADCDGGACAGVTLCPCGDDCLVPDEAGTC
ncbi:MAG: hypothetical protein FJ098_14885, partial [Deltaproteobacteria bacterium]|nr:hypothetical protein [Deltaproteobacteria bacterium]